MAGRSSHRASRTREPSGALAYLIVLAGAAAGLLLAGIGGGHAVRGAAVTGCALLAAALARLVLPPRHAGMLVSRNKALDVITFAVLGGGVLVVALLIS
jgi:Protein of unknown function (DUF3017)